MFEVFGTLGHRQFLFHDSYHMFLLLAKLHNLKTEGRIKEGWFCCSLMKVPSAGTRDSFNFTSATAKKLMDSLILQKTEQKNVL